MTRIPVRLAGRKCLIAVGRGLLGRAGTLLAPLLSGRLVVCVSSAPVIRIAGSRFARSLVRARTPARWLTVPDGERAKTMGVLESLLRHMARVGVDRRSFVIAFGGGTVGDVAGLSAAMYARGIGMVQVPTTLVGQVDSAIGGKTAVDLPEGKNLVGAFHQPAAVICDPDALLTLPDRQYRAGLAEVVKYGVIASPSLFELLERSRAAVVAREPVLLERIVVTCARIKARVVSADERETTGLRTMLNFGHTLGHGLEAATGFGGMLHGEAVAIGMVAAARLSAKLGVCRRETPGRISALLSSFGLPVSLPRSANRSAVVAAMARDKKRAGHGLRVVLTPGMGGVRVRDGISPGQLIGTL
jgi:3-dehydroquinate synthase